MTAGTAVSPERMILKSTVPGNVIGIGVHGPWLPSGVGGSFFILGRYLNRSHRWPFGTLQRLLQGTSNCSRGPGSLRASQLGSGKP